MAEGISRRILPNNILINSAGTEAHGLNPIAVKVMNDISIPISNQKSTKISNEKFNKFDIIITLCGDARDKCPISDFEIKHIHWGIEDPAIFKGDENQTYMKYKEVRDIIYNKINDLKKELE